MFAIISPRDSGVGAAYTEYPVPPSIDPARAYLPQFNADIAVGVKAALPT